MKYGYNHGYVLLHFTDFFCLNIHYFYILFEYSVKMCMRVIDIPYVTLSMHSKHIRDVHTTVCSEGCLKKRARKRKLLLDSARCRHLIEKKDLKKVNFSTDLSNSDKTLNTYRKCTHSKLTELTPVFLT